MPTSFVFPFRLAGWRVLTLLALLLAPQWLLAQSWQWAVTPLSVSPGITSISASRLDGSGNLVVAGYFSGTATFGTTTLTSSGTNDVFVARLRSDGVWQQAVRAGGTGETRALALALDAADNIIISGTLTGTATFGAVTLTNSGRTPIPDLFVARLSSAGTWTSAVRTGTPLGWENVVAMAADGLGNVVLGGTYSGPTTSFGTFALSNQNPMEDDGFVARLSSANVWTQVASIEGGDRDLLTGLTLDQNGTVHVTGYFISYSIQFGSIRVDNASSVLPITGTYPTLYVASLNPAGTWVRALRLFNYGGVYPSALTGDGQGNLVVGGRFVGSSLEVGPYRLSTGRSADYDQEAFVARLSSTGQWTQAVRAGSRGDDGINSLALDGQGNVVVGGYFTGATAQFGPLTLTNSTPPVPPSVESTLDVLVARLSTSGTWTHALAAGGAGYDVAADVVVDPSGNTIIATGSFIGPAVFGPTTLTSPSTVLSTQTTVAFAARVGGLPLSARPATTRSTLQVSPNPASTQATLTLPPTVAARQVVLLDALGRVVRRHPLPARATTTALPLAGLPAGLYFVRCGAATTKLWIE